MQAMTTSNIIRGDEYKQMVIDILKYVGQSVCQTLGPCANTSIIEEMGPLVASKDGFHTLTRIRFGNEDIFANNIMRVITTMAHRTVSLVGDGSSSSVVAAWKFAEVILKNMNDAEYMRPREMNKVFNEAIRNIGEYIQEHAIQPTKEEIPEVMRKVAYIATNGDDKFADMMKEIYEKAGPGVAFHIEKSPIWATETKYFEVGGYKANQYYLIGNGRFHNMPGAFAGKDVHLICFDMALNSTHWNLVQHIIQRAHFLDSQEGLVIPREIIVFAPDYDQLFLDKLQRYLEMEDQMLRSKSKAHYDARYARFLSINAWQRAEFMDFCMLAGSSPVTATDFNDMVDLMEGTENFNDEILDRSIGMVGQIICKGNEYTIINGFPKKKEELFEQTMNQLEALYEKEYAENATRRVSSTDFAMLRKRIRKLQCNTVEIIIGAVNEYEMVLNLDAADDATRACESVAQYGYNVGCNLAIVNAASELWKSTEDRKYKFAYSIIQDTFTAVLQEVYANAWSNAGYGALPPESVIWVEERITESLRLKKPYDLIKEEFSDDIINSPRTDIEILNGAISICLTLMTANQYIGQIPNIPVEEATE